MNPGLLLPSPTSHTTVERGRPGTLRAEVGVGHRSLEFKDFFLNCAVHVSLTARARHLITCPLAGTCLLLDVSWHQRAYISNVTVPSQGWPLALTLECFSILTGLLTATVASRIHRAAQPALLYLVPFTLLPLLTMAYLKVREAVINL